MRRLWKVAVAATTLSVAGCGTVANLRNVEGERGEGRQAFGGVGRDFAILGHPPAIRISSGNRGFGALLRPLFDPVFSGGVTLLVLGGVALDTPLSLFADACTLPLIPVLDQFDGTNTWPPPARSYARQLAESPVEQFSPAQQQLPLEGPTRGQRNDPPVISITDPSVGTTMRPVGQVDPPTDVAPLTPTPWPWERTPGGTVSAPAKASPK
jgi:hypothetical protein